MLIEERSVRVKSPANEMNGSATPSVSESAEMTNAEKLQARIASLAREKGSKAIQFTVIIREGEIVAFPPEPRPFHRTWTGLAHR